MRRRAELYLDTDLDGSGGAMAIVTRDGVRFSIELDRDDVRRLAEWSAQVAALGEGT